MIEFALVFPVENIKQRIGIMVFYLR
jgi:hypothetical protein